MLTYDDLTGFHCLCDLVGTAHLWVAHSSQHEDDEAWACSAIILSTGFVLLTGTEKQIWDETNLLSESCRERKTDIMAQHKIGMIKKLTLDSIKYKKRSKTWGSKCSDSIVSLEGTNESLSTTCLFAKANLNFWFPCSGCLAKIDQCLLFWRTSV